MLRRTRPDSFYSPRNITGQSTFWFGCLPTFWSKGKYNKNLDDELMDSSICQDVSLLSGSLLKAWDASKIFIKSSRALQGWEAITDLQEREGEQGCFATSGKKGLGKGVRSEPRREIGKHRCTHFRVPPTFPLEPHATRVNICLWTLVTWLVTRSGGWGLVNNTWHLIPKPCSSSKSFFLLYYTCSREYTTSYKEENCNILPITLRPQKNF